MVFDKTVDFQISDKTIKLCYPLKCVWEAERQLSEKNFLLLISKAVNEVPPGMGDIYVIFKYALLGGNPGMTEEQADELYLKALEERPMIDLFRAALQALEKSGILGKRKKEQAAEA